MSARPPEVEAAPFFVLRSALLPFEEWLAFADGMTAAAADDDQLEAALAADRERARARLRALVARTDVREALFIASPSLDEAIDAWLRAPDSERGLKAERSLVRYLARMCGRSTPFGLFAGCALGRVARGATRLTLSARSAYRRHTRLDMDYLFALAETLARDPELRAQIRFRPNSSLYRAAARIRYVESRLAGKSRSYHLVAVEPTDYLDATLDRARAGAKLAELATALARDAEVSDEEAREFVDELVTQQLLVSDLEAPVTGPEPIHALLRRLEGHAAAAPLLVARDALAAIDAKPLGVATALYRDIAAGLSTLPVEVELARLFQVDLVTQGESLTIGDAVVREVGRAVETLHRMAEPTDPLRRFREAFTERYESAVVPLTEVLDEESGIGFNRSNAPSADASPLIEGLAFPATPDVEVRWGARQQLVFGKLMGAIGRREREIRLEESDFALLSGSERPRLPDSFAVLASIVADSAAALDEGRFRLHMTAAAGPSGANLLGRFCHGDAELESLVREELRVEESLRPDAIFAEIVHLPEGRVGNVLLRPLLREYELPFLGASGAPADRQIAVEDLTVSVEGNRVVMRSRRLGREIIPRLTTAHNHSSPRSLGLYRFLCMLQSQGVASGLGWSWAPFESAPFLPRVVCGQVVLAPARWRLERAQLAALGEGIGIDRWRAAQKLRRDLELPRLVFLEEGDNRLPIDLDHVLSVETFVHLVKDRPEAVLSEMPAADGDLPVSGPEGHFVHELVVPFRRRAQSATATATATPTATATATLPVASPAANDRRLPPGSDWLYVKLYAGAATVDQILRDVIAPTIHDGRAAGAIREWFFVRYGDPDWHLRVRIHGDAARLRAEVEPALRSAAGALMAEGRLWRLQHDTYHREVERYGGPVGMRLCEQLFAADSDAVLAIIEALAGDAGADARWRLCIRGIDGLLADLGFDLDTKYAIVKELRAGFGREHSVDVAFEKQLGDRFRRERAGLETLLTDAVDPEHPLALGFSILAERTARQAPIGAELQAAARAGGLTLPLPALAGSLVHMHANRLLRASARANELVLYDFLARLYEGRRARRRRPS